MEDTLHAYRNPMWITPGDHGFTMITGPGRSGALLEVGFIRAEDGTAVIIHSMPARRRFIPRKR